MADETDLHQSTYSGNYRPEVEVYLCIRVLVPNVPTVVYINFIC